MNKLLALALSLPLVACVVGSEAAPGDDSPGGGGGGGTGGGGGGGTGGGGGGTTHITAPTTWSGAMDVTQQTIVDPGVTLTIAAGTTVHFASGAGLTVQGKVLANGEKGSLVQLAPATAGGHYNDFTVGTGGELTLTYVALSGGAFAVSGSGKVTITDTTMSQAPADLLTVGGGTVTVSHSTIGIASGDTTHCNLHFDGNGTRISVTYTDILGVPYGLMLYGGQNVDLTYNNWFSNQMDIATQLGPPVSADISNSWFEKTAPVSGSVATYTNNTPSATKRTDTGPR